MRVVEQPVHERILARRFRVTQRPRQLAHHAVDHHHRRELAAGEHVVADRNLVVRCAPDQSLVDPFVASGEHHDALLFRKLRHQRVIEHAPLRRQVHHSRLRYTTAFLPLPRRRQRFFQRLGHHHHAWSAAIRAIVDAAVIVGREVARIPQHQVIQPALPRPAGHAASGHRLEHRRKQCHDVDLQHQ
jgi:hypothetical protein